MIAVTVIGLLCVLLLAVVLTMQRYRKRKESQPTLPPGPKSTTTETGNGDVVTKAGGLVPFLYENHKKYGPVISFKYAKVFCVSMTSPEIWMQHKSAYNKPNEIFEFWKSILGPHSIQWANGEDAKRKRRVLARQLASKSVKRLFPIFQQLGNNIADEWGKVPKEQGLHLQDPMLILAMGTVLKAGCGGHMGKDEFIRECGTHCKSIIQELLLRTEGTYPEPGSNREKQQNSALENVRGNIRKLAKERRENPPSEEDKLYVDFLIDDGSTDEELEDEVLTHLLGGSHTASEAMTWTMYFLAQHPDIQEKLFAEMEKEIGDKPVTFENMDALRYTRQVVDEVIRLSTVITIATRIQNEEQIIGGYRIPKGTSVLHALAVQHTDPKYWEEPKKFNPDRFAPDKIKDRDAMAFKPFGFAGQRTCPAMKYSYAAITTWLGIFVRRFKFTLKDDGNMEGTGEGNMKILNSALGKIYVNVEPRHSSL